MAWLRAADVVEFAVARLSRPGIDEHPSLAGSLQNGYGNAASGIEP